MNQLITINTNQGLIIKNPKDNYYYNTLSFLDVLNGAPITEDGIRKYFKHLDGEYKAGRYKAKTVLIKRAAVKNRIKNYFDGLDYENNQRLNFVLKQIDKEIKAPKVNSCIITESKVVLDDNYKRLLDSCNTDRQSLYIEFLCNSALRINELVNIRLTDIKDQGLMSEITIRGKGTKERVIRIESGIVQAARSVFKGQIFLFETEKHKQCNKNYISNIITKIGNRAGLHISAHTLRHTWATIAYKQHPESIPDLARFMGHSDIKTFLSFYAHNELSDQDLMTVISYKKCHKGTYDNHTKRGL